MGSVQTLTAYAHRNEVRGLYNRAACFHAENTVTCFLQVTAHLDANNILTIEAQDLDSGRHHLWKHGGGSVVADGIHASELNTNGHYVVDYSQSQAMQQPMRA